MFGANFLEFFVALAAGLFLLGIQALVDKKTTRGILFLVLGGIALLAMYWPSLLHKLSVWTAPFTKAVSSVSLTVILFFWFYIAYTVISRRVEKHLASQLREELAPLRSNLDFYLRPRTLAPEQASAIATYLLRHAPEGIHVRVPANDSEATNFMANIVSSLIKGGWKPLSTVYSEQQVNPGLSMQIEHAGQPQPFDPKHPTPDYLLGEALRQGGIPPNGVANSYASQAYKLTLSIGPRPLIIDSSPPTAREMPPPKAWR